MSNNIRNKKIIGNLCDLFKYTNNLLFASYRGYD